MLVTVVINCKLLNCVECGQTKHDQFVIFVPILTISALCVVIGTRWKANSMRKFRKVEALYMPMRATCISE